MRAKGKKTYKVWIEIEEYDEDTESGETVDCPGGSVATFDTYDDAVQFAEQLQEQGTNLQAGLPVLPGEGS